MVDFIIRWNIGRPDPEVNDLCLQFTSAQWSRKFNELKVNDLDPALLGHTTPHLYRIFWKLTPTNTVVTCNLHNNCALLALNRVEVIKSIEL